MKPIKVCVVVRVMSEPSGDVSESVVSIRQLWIDRKHQQPGHLGREPVLLGLGPERHVTTIQPWRLN